MTKYWPKRESVYGFAESFRKKVEGELKSRKSNKGIKQPSFNHIYITSSFAKEVGIHWANRDFEEYRDAS